MSTTIGKQQTAQVDHARAAARTGDANKVAMRFNPEGAAAQQQTPVQRGPDLFSKVIAEATDGDATEATARASLGLARRDGVREDNDTFAPGAADSAQRGRRARPEQEPEQDQNGGGDPVVNSLKRRKVSGATTSAAEVASPKATAPRAEVHEALMRVTSTMQKSQVATHVSHGHSQNLVRIQQQPHWVLQRAALDDLNAAQMALAR